MCLRGRHAALMTDPTGELLRDTDPQGLTRVQVRLDDDSLWLSQADMAELYGPTSQNITQHVKAIYA